MRIMFEFTGAIFLVALLLYVVPATTEMEYFPGLRRPPPGLSNWPQSQNELLNQLSNIIEEQARRRFQHQLAQQQYYQTQNNRHQQHLGTDPQRNTANEPGFTYEFPDSANRADEPIEFAVNPSDSRYHDNTQDGIENSDRSLNNNVEEMMQPIGDAASSQNTNNNEEHLISKPAEDVPYYKLKPPMDVNPKAPVNIIRDDLKALLEKLQKDGQASAILNGGRVGGAGVTGSNGVAAIVADRTEVVKKHMGMDDSLGMYIVALIAGISAAVTVGLIALIIAWYTLHKRAKLAADVEYPAYGVTGPNKDISPSGDRRLAQSAQMYHYQHQKQQIIAMENRNSGEHPGGISDVESDDENEEGDYTVYECPGLAPTGEMEVKNPLFLDDTPVTPSMNAGDSQNPQQPASSQKQQTPKKHSAAGKQSHDAATTAATGTDSTQKPGNKQK